MFSTDTLAGFDEGSAVASGTIDVALLLGDVPVAALAVKGMAVVTVALATEGTESVVCVDDSVVEGVKAGVMVVIPVTVDITVDSTVGDVRFPAADTVVGRVVTSQFCQLYSGTSVGARRHS